jgi:hypothetical protein
VARLGFFHRVDGERAHGIDAALIDIGGDILAVVRGVGWS